MISIVQDFQLCQCIPEIVTGVSPVGEAVAQPREAPSYGFEGTAGTVVVLDMDGVHGD